MINFEEELKYFKPILEMEEMEGSINNDEITDIIDIIKEMEKDKKQQRGYLNEMS